MPDISCCINNECPLRFSCFRWMAEWSERQSVSKFTPTETVNIDERQIRTSCDYFMPIREGAILDESRKFAKWCYERDIADELADNTPHPVADSSTDAP